MGGFTQIYLRDKSRNNIDKHNALLKLYKVPKKYRYQSEADVILQYEAFKINDGVWQPHLFPRDKIKSLSDFKNYWSSSALGDVFCPPNGTLQFDCYFGRTSNYAMRNIGRYISDHYKDIEKTQGSFCTFAERGMTKLEQQLLKENNLL